VSCSEDTNSWHYFGGFIFSQDVLQLHEVTEQLYHLETFAFVHNVKNILKQRNGTSTSATT